MREVVVEDYDPAWVLRFEEMRARVWPVVHDVAESIEHVGSTAVVGLAAKPIIDMTIVVGSRERVAVAIERLRSAGFEHRGDLGIAGREAFLGPSDFPPHRLYLCARGSVALANHLAVRDFLRSHPEVALAYGALKQQLAVQFRNDIEGYVEAKTGFITSILERVGFPADARARIVRENRRRDNIA